jgi:excisionase family DNA binding protein
MSSDTLLRVHDVAKLLGLSVGSVYHLISQKRIPVVKVSSRCVRFRRSDIDAWIASLVCSAKSTDGT